MDDPLAFTKAGQGILFALRGGVRTVAQSIMHQSLIEVPKDTGVLAGSARIFPVEQNSRVISETFGYGFGFEINPITKRPASDYAVPVHEIMEAIHESPTKAKFLEDPVLDHASLVQRQLAYAIKAEGAKGWTPPLVADLETPIIGLLPGEKVEARSTLIGGGAPVRGAGGRFVRRFAR